MAINYDYTQIPSFEVGAQQFEDFSINFSGFYNGDWVLVMRYDEYSGVLVWQRSESKAEIIESLKFALLADWQYGHFCQYEIWHLVDDGDLWQEWDVLASAAQVAEYVQDTEYHVMDGMRCVLDLENCPDKVWSLVHVFGDGSICETRYYDRDHKDQLVQDIGFSIDCNGNHLLNAQLLDGVQAGVVVEDDNEDFVASPWLVVVYVQLAES